MRRRIPATQLLTAEASSSHKHANSRLLMQTAFKRKINFVGIGESDIVGNVTSIFLLLLLLPSFPCANVPYHLLFPLTQSTFPVTLSECFFPLSSVRWPIGLLSIVYTLCIVNHRSNYTLSPLLTGRYFPCTRQPAQSTPACHCCWPVQFFGHNTMQLLHDFFCRKQQRMTHKNQTSSITKHLKLCDTWKMETKNMQNVSGFRWYYFGFFSSVCRIRFSVHFCPPEFRVKIHVVRMSSAYMTMIKHLNDR